MHSLFVTQKLNMSMEEAWDFFSSPLNLREITPSHLGFKITSEVPEKMYPGLIISYIVKPILGIPLAWFTEITHVRDKEFFVDSQISGPYSIWHHEHHFREIEGGVEMKDILYYKIPMGFLGRILNFLFIGRQVKGIFTHRSKVLAERFGEIS